MSYSLGSNPDCLTNALAHGIPVLSTTSKLGSSLRQRRRGECERRLLAEEFWINSVDHRPALVRRVLWREDAAEVVVVVVVVAVGDVDRRRRRFKKMEGVFIFLRLGRSLLRV
jgi:hypothetical protein